MLQEFKGYMTDEAITDARKQSYNEGWNDAVYEIFMLIENGTSIDKIKDKLSRMGK